ncbi:CDP-glycerol glycerophosphotransferase family protein, partial [Mammaliicoccus sciuri]
MVRSIIKQVYLSVIFVFNKLFKSNVKSKNVVVFMTFKEDVLPIIEALKKEQYHITVIAHPKWIDFLNDIDVD